MIEPIKDVVWSGEFTIHDPSDMLLTFDEGRRLAIYADRPMIFFRRWFYELMVAFFGWTYPQIVVWSGEIGRITKLETTELEDGRHRVEWTSQIEKVDP
jgi:hypothetical protein